MQPYIRGVPDADLCRAGIDVYRNDPDGSYHLCGRYSAKLEVSLMFGTYCRLWVNVHASDRQLVRKARQFLTTSKNDPSLREARKEFYRFMLEHHREARQLARAFQL